MAFFDAINEPRIEALRPSFEGTNLDFETSVNEGLNEFTKEYASFTKARLIQNDVKGAAIIFVVNYLLELLKENVKLHPDLPSMRAVGYRQAWQYLDGAITLQEFKDQSVAATRQLAKRQLTWLRGMGHREIFDPLLESEMDRCEQVCLAHYQIK